MSVKKIITVDKFLGLHEPSDGSTELKPGEASLLENFTITDDYNLKLRPGVRRVDDMSNMNIKDLTITELRGKRWLVCIYQNQADPRDCSISLISTTDDSTAQLDSTGIRYDRPVKYFVGEGKLYLAGCALGTEDTVRIVGIHDSDSSQIEMFDDEPHAYEPVVLTGCSPMGGGTELESINLFNETIRLQYSATGEDKSFQLPSIVNKVLRVSVDSAVVNAGEYDDKSHCYCFDAPPEKGVNNVEFRCTIADDDFKAARKKFLQMKHSEAYNGTTDTRFFFYGDGTNICYYTGIPAFGSGPYLPIGNEIAVNASSSPITGMQRHYTKLMAFKSDGTFTIDYSPLTLEDGRVIAGFYVQPVHRTIGSEMDGQIQTVENYPRTLSNGVLYEWRNNASIYQDERCAKPISQPVANTIRCIDRHHLKDIVTCDDNANSTYYMFLNDGTGRVLVHRYNIDVWTIYKGECFKNVNCAVADGDGTVYLSCNQCVCRLDESYGFDDCFEGQDTLQSPIAARWESGYYAMGMDYRRKYSSYLWISMLPEENSRMDVTVKTDRRDTYITKTIGVPLLSWESMDFSNFSFLFSRSPRMKRIKLKAKKYVYYKLIFTVNHPGARATVLSYDQQVRYASEVK